MPKLLPGSRIYPDDQVELALRQVVESSPVSGTRPRAGWFFDIEDPSLVNIYRVNKVLYEKQSEYQLIQLVEFDHFGEGLVLDGRIQMTESDEHIYHEMLVHPAIVMARDSKRILILGGGDGCTLREVLKWPHVELARQVEIDGDVIDLFSTQHPDWTNGAFMDPRTEVVVDDALSVLNSDETWDVIIADLTEPYDDSGVAGDLSRTLYTKDFFAAVACKLNPGGVFAAQSGGIRYTSMVRHASLDRHHVQIVDSITEAFGSVQIAYAYIPSFNAHWTVTFASPDGLPEKCPVESALDQNPLDLKFYSVEAHQRIFRQSVLLKNVYRTQAR